MIGLTAATVALAALSASIPAQQKAEPKKDAKVDDAPKAIVKLEGRTVTRSRISNDTGTRLVWRVIREYVDEKTRQPAKAELEIDARPAPDYTHPEAAPGKYTITLELFLTARSGRNKDGYHTAADPRTSKLTPIAPPVSYVVPGGPAAEPAKAEPKKAAEKADKKK
jgi:hypothetical protein